MMSLRGVEDCLLIGSSTDIECESKDEYRDIDKVPSGYRRVTVYNDGLLSTAIESVISQPVVDTRGFNTGGG
jgi:hypothetical protein